MIRETNATFQTVITLKQLALAAALLAMSPLTAHAVPSLYRTTYSATLGPSGTGSFLFDPDIGVLSSFLWDFGGGIVGGHSGL